MFDLRKITIAASVSMLVLGTAADAATLADIQGRVLVNSGSGYQAVSGSLELKPGDLVMAGLGGGATLSFEDGCVSAVGPGAVVAISQHSPCVTQVQAQQQQGSGMGGSGGGGGNTTPTGVSNAGGSLASGANGSGPAVGAYNPSGVAGFAAGPLAAMPTLAPVGLALGIGIAGGIMGITTAINNADKPPPSSP